MDLENQKIYVIQRKAKRKGSNWRDYMVFNALLRAQETFEEHVNRPVHHGLAGNETRLIYRDIHEQLLRQ
jgi:hypothetical protein